MSAEIQGGPYHRGGRSDFWGDRREKLAGAPGWRKPSERRGRITAASGGKSPPAEAKPHAWSEGEVRGPATELWPPQHPRCKLPSPDKCSQTQQQGTAVPGTSSIRQVLNTLMRAALESGARRKRSPGSWGTGSRARGGSRHRSVLRSGENPGRHTDRNLDATLFQGGGRREVGGGADGETPRQQQGEESEHVPRPSRLPRQNP